MIAFVDESIRQAEGGVYLLAAVLVPRARAGDVRQSLRDSLLFRQHRFHWRDENTKQRDVFLRRLIDMELPSVVVSTDWKGGRDDRCRALCMRRLLWELGTREVTEIVIESRQARGDQRDRRTILHSQQARWASVELRYSFQKPADEPLLWAADAVAGAARSEDWLPLLGELVTLIRA